jgi:hypothetical protein
VFAFLLAAFLLLPQEIENKSENKTIKGKSFLIIKLIKIF